MRPVWRWFGPDDPITLMQIREAGAKGVVTALHDHPPGTVWPAGQISRTSAAIRDAGLSWDVCESIWMPDEIKLRGSDAKAEVAAWIETLRNLAQAGVRIICYNFMPLLDWTRTDLNYEIEGRGRALRFDMVDFIAYDVFILGRPGADGAYSPALLSAAEARFQGMPPAARDTLETNIIAGLPGAATGFTRQDLLERIGAFAELSHAGLQANLASFLAAVVPQAEKLGVRLAIHPDDPPMPLFGLPRCVSTADDLRFLLASRPSRSNGLTFCTGSLGAHPDNDLPALAAELREHIHFAHLRNVRREADRSFHEAAVFEGSTPMIDVLRQLLRSGSGPVTDDLPFRPDHGHLLDYESTQMTNPGYSYLGRMKGLAELQGAIAGLKGA